MAKTKQIEWSGTIDDRIEVVCRILGINGDIDVFVINTLFKIDSGRACPFDLHQKNIACLKSGVNVNTFGVSLSRLMKKGIVLKIGNAYQLHPVFVDLDKTDSITIKWKK